MAFVARAIKYLDHAGSRIDVRRWMQTLSEALAPWSAVIYRFTAKNTLARAGLQPPVLPGAIAICFKTRRH